MKIAYIFGLFITGIACFSFAYIIQEKSKIDLKKYQEAVQDSGAILLTEVKLCTRTNDENPEIVSKIRFLTKSGCPTAVYLPTTDNYGYGIVFNIRYTLQKELLLGSYAISERFWLPEMSGRLEEYRREGPYNQQTLHRPFNSIYPQKVLDWNQEYEFSNFKYKISDICLRLQSYS